MHVMCTFLILHTLKRKEEVGIGQLDAHIAHQIREEFLINCRLRLVGLFIAQNDMKN